MLDHHRPDRNRVGIGIEDELIGQRTEVSRYKAKVISKLSTDVQGLIIERQVFVACSKGRQLLTSVPAAIVKLHLPFVGNLSHEVREGRDIARAFKAELNHTEGMLSLTVSTISDYGDCQSNSADRERSHMEGMASGLVWASIPQKHERQKWGRFQNFGFRRENR